MKNAPLPLPQQDNYEYSLGLAYEIAREQLSRMDIDRQCRHCGATYKMVDSKKIVTLSYLNHLYNIVVSGGTVSPVDNSQDITSREKLLILHYLINARGTALSKEIISLKDIPDVKNYFRTFSKRVLQRFIDSFGKAPLTLLDAGKILGGEKTAYGDIAMTINAFERVPVTFVLWHGDSEFPADGNVIFDSNIADYLPPEDIVVLSEILTWKLVMVLNT